MQTNKLHVILLFLLAITIGLVACIKNNYSYFNEDNSSFSGSIRVEGLIQDDYGIPISNATISVGNRTTLTGIDGKFKLLNAPVNESELYIKVKKDGYLVSGKRLLVKNNAAQYFELQLVKEKAYSISGINGGEITHYFSNNTLNGTLLKIAYVRLPANATVYADSKSQFTGSIKVKIGGTSPDLDNFFQQIPGDLRGIDSSGRQVVFESFGMLGIELVDNLTGRKLELASGKKATIRLTLNTLISRAPASIPIWHFNDSTGIWHQEGFGTKVSNTYTASVSHFSWWNWDLPIIGNANSINNTNSISTPSNAVLVSGRVIDSITSKPLSYTRLSFLRDTTIFQNSTFSDENGYFRVYLPTNFKYKIQVFNSCNDIVHSKIFQIGTSNTDLGNIKADVTAAGIAIKGIFKDCNGNLIAGGQVQVATSKKLLVFPIKNGLLDARIAACDGKGIARLSAINYIDKRNCGLINISIDNNDINLGEKTCCTVSDNYLDLEIDSTRYILFNPLWGFRSRITWAWNFYGENYLDVQAGSYFSNLRINCLYMPFQSNGSGNVLYTDWFQFYINSFSLGRGSGSVIGGINNTYINPYQQFVYQQIMIGQRISGGANHLVGNWPGSLSRVKYNYSLVVTN
jgi:hypothetical protein